MDHSGKITEVSESDNYYSISADGIGFGLDKKYGAVPKVGDDIIVYSEGSTVRGVTLNGKKLYYKTDKQLSDEHEEWRRKYQQQKEDNFKKDRQRLDKVYNSLPDFFKKRIDRFRANNPDFRVDYESYEMFCITEAILIADHFSKGVDLTIQANKKLICKEIEEWSKKGWTEQHKEIPTIDDGHSGNTFGMAVKLAWLYIDEPSNVSKCHGSLSTLVGSEDFGDIKGRKQIRQRKLERIKEITKMNQFKNVVLPTYLTCKSDLSLHHLMPPPFTRHKKYKVEGSTPNYVWIVSDRIDPNDGRPERYKFKITDYDYYFDEEYGLELYFYTPAEERKLKLENLPK